MEWEDICDVAGMLCLLPVTLVIYGYRYTTNKLTRITTRTYRNKVQLRRPITPTTETVAGSDDAKSFLWRFQRQRKQQPVLEQRQAPFFRLPTELKLRIYEELLCGRTICYTGSQNRRIRSWKWKAMAEHDLEREAILSDKVPGKLPSPIPVALLRTCRRVYLETIGLLYSNRFQLLGHPYDLISPRRIARLPRLKLLIPIDAKREGIEPFCEATFYEWPQLRGSFARLREVPQVDLAFQIYRAREHSGYYGSAEDWLRTTEDRLLKMVDKAWKGAPGHMTVTVHWKISNKNRERKWAFDLVEATPSDVSRIALSRAKLEI